VIEGGTSADGPRCGAYSAPADGPDKDAPMPILARDELEQSHISDLHAIASELGIEGYRRLRRPELIDAIVAGSDGDSGDDDERPRPARRRGGRRKAAEADAEASEQETEPKEPPTEPKEAEPEPEEVRTGVLDILPNGSGFVRAQPFAHSSADVYVSPAQIRRCELRAGDVVAGPVRKPRRSERHPSLVRVDEVNGGPADPPPERPRFDELTPVFPRERLPVADGLERAPFGKGSRVAIGGPPGAGTTTLLRRIALSLADAADVELIVVLAGVRPEEVTEWRREERLTVAGGSFDRPPDEQAQVAELAVERAKRAAEAGRNAAVVIDSLDALPAGAARRVFGAGRATEEGGSLTVIAATGTAGEPMRLATTRIVLEPPGDAGEPRLAAASGALRADELK
jgi:transcription termination factor Rho